MICDLGIVVAAGGSGNRYGKQNKLLEKLGEYPVFIHCLKTFSGICPQEQIVLVVPEPEIEIFNRSLQDHMPLNRIALVAGGDSRARSVMNGLNALPESIRFVAVHDAARPFITAEMVRRCLESARQYGAAVPAKPVTDTLKKSRENNLIAGTVDRSELWRVETPQIFDLAKLKAAYFELARRIDEFTDDAAVMEAAGCDVALVDTPENNLKITYPRDMAIAGFLLNN